MKLALKIFGGIIVLLLLLVGGLVAYIDYELRPEVLTQNIESLLRETLGTEVHIKECRLALEEQRMTVTGLDIKDRKSVDMLYVDNMDAKVDLWELWHRRLLVRRIKLTDSRCVLYKERKDTAANYQFVVDAITFISRERSKEQIKKEKKAKLKWDVRDVLLSNIDVKWDVKSEVARSSKAYRKRYPHRGYFDANHLDVNISLEAKDIYLQGDSASMQLRDVNAKERLSGLELTELSTNLEKSGQRFYARDLQLRSKETTVGASLVSGTIPSKKKGMKFRLRADSLKIHAVLQNIAKPFAPALWKFRTPLEATVNVVGNDSCFHFNKIHVFTKDGRLSVRARGRIRFPKMGTKRKRPAKYDTSLFFTVSSMHARRGIKKQIIGHFAKISPALTTILVEAGDVRFRGYLYIPYKREHIWGHVATDIGHLKGDVWLNDTKKTMKGTVSSNDVDLKKMTGNKNLGLVAFKAAFDLDIAKHVPKTKMPRGTFSGTALYASYKKLHIKNIDFDIKSDGKYVAGCVDMDRTLIGLSCDFSFQGSDIKKTLKIKPHLKIHNIWRAIFGKKKSKAERAKEKAEKQKAKELKKKEKEKRKKEKEAMKAARKVLKEKMKQEKQAAKEKAKAEKEMKNKEKETLDEGSDS